MRVRWTAPAAADLDQIREYLQKYYPHFAQPTVLRVYQSIRSLKAAPHRGRLGRRNGTRELVLAPLPYLVVYRSKTKPSKSCTSTTVLGKSLKLAMVAFAATPPNPAAGVE